MKKFAFLLICSCGISSAFTAQTADVTPTHPSVMFQTVTGAVNEISLDRSIKIFPNPTNNQLNIILEDGYDINFCDVYIYDEKGRLILTEKDHSFKNRTFAINSQNFSAGLYTLVLKTTNNGATVNKKFIITK